MESTHIFAPKNMKTKISLTVSIIAVKARGVSADRTSWYPDYSKVFNRGTCINSSPAPVDIIKYTSQRACCERSYAGQSSGACLLSLPGSILSPVWFPALYADQKCVSTEFEHRNHGVPAYDTQLECCIAEFGHGSDATRALKIQQGSIQIHPEAVDIPLNWAAEVEEIIDDYEGQDTFLTNPSILFMDDGNGSVQLVRAVRLFSFHQSFIIQSSERGLYKSLNPDEFEDDEILQQIYNYRSSILIQSEPFLGDLSAPFDSLGAVQWGLDGVMPMKPIDRLLHSPLGDTWGEVCQPKPKFERHKLIRVLANGAEDPKVTLFPGHKWGISYSSYPQPSNIFGKLDAKAVGCKWSPKTVFQMHLAPEGKSLLSGENSTGYHLGCDLPSNANEKNWISFLFDNKLHYMRSIEPVSVVGVDIKDTGSCRELYSDSESVPSKFFEGIASRHGVRGNGNAVRWSETEFLALLHTMDKNPGGGYITRTFKFEAKPPFRVTGVSKPLPLYNEGFAFASSLSVQSDKVLVGYGVEDQDSRVLVTSKNYMDSLFIEEAYLSNSYAMAMEERHLKSFSHQKKFLERGDQLTGFFSRKERFSDFTGEYAALKLTNKLAYLHIWKSGGTTVSYQPGTSETMALSDPEISGFDLVTFVRDPIDHFLLGWSEANFRAYEESEGSTMLPEWREEDYDERIRVYLRDVVEQAYRSTSPEMTHLITSFPQANFLLDQDGNVNEHVKIIGLLDEMSSVMDTIGFKHDIHDWKAPTNQVKATHFPVRRDLISDETLLQICAFVAMDFFLFDFQPPEICDQQGGPLKHLVADPYATSMSARHMRRSLGHQDKFLHYKDKIVEFFSRTQRFVANTGEYGGVKLNDEFAYLHIWKSGGTSIEYQPGVDKQKALSHPDISSRDLLTFIRDPINHFLSGWAEASFRVYEKNAGNGNVLREWKEEEYDDRIRTYLEETKQLAYEKYKHTDMRKDTPNTHSFPQANFLLTLPNRTVNDHIKIIGDISEMSSVMEMVGFKFDSSIRGRTGTEDPIKAKHFPVRKDLLSDETMISICEFVAIDYFLFAFVPPEICNHRGGPLDFSY